MIQTLQLDIPLILPEVHDSSDACVRRLTDEIAGRPGVTKAHVVDGAEAKEPHLCVHYDPAVISLSRLRELVTASGAAITERFGHAVWQVQGIQHERRARTITESTLR